MECGQVSKASVFGMENRRFESFHSSFKDYTFPLVINPMVVFVVTPTGQLCPTSFMKASTLSLSKVSTRSHLLCFRISNCSRDYLFTWGERKRVNFVFFVGRGTTPPKGILCSLDNTFILSTVSFKDPCSKDLRRIKLSFNFKVTLFFFVQRWIWTTDLRIFSPSL